MKRICIIILLITLTTSACGKSNFGMVAPTSERTGASVEVNERTPKLALWLAKKDDLIANPQAKFDLVMTSWFEPQEASTLISRYPSAKLLGGLSHTWIADDPGWQSFLVTVANQGDPNGTFQITDDMYLLYDEDGDDNLDRRCSPPGWENIYAMDPRSPKWRELILAFYKTVADQSQHSGVIVDMLDAYPFCKGASSLGNSTPLDARGWVTAQEEILALIRKNTPSEKWVIANAGHGFDENSPFPQYLNGFLLENFLGSWGAGLEEGLHSAQRALETTQPPHIVVFAVDTENTGEVDWNRFRVGLAASLLMDNIYFAFDFGPRDHGAITGWWFPNYYDISLGKPLGPYTIEKGNYRRDFEEGVIVIAQQSTVELVFDANHVDVSSGNVGTEFRVSKGDAGIFLRKDE